MSYNFCTAAMTASCVPLRFSPGWIGLPMAYSSCFLSSVPFQHLVYSLLGSFKGPSHLCGTSSPKRP